MLRSIRAVLALSGLACVLVATPAAASGVPAVADPTGGRAAAAVVPAVEALRPVVDQFRADARTDAQLQAAAATSDLALLRAAVRCAVLDGESYCLYVGFTPLKAGTPQFEERLQQLAAEPVSDTGDMRVVDQVKADLALGQTKRTAAEAAEMESAVLAVGKVKLADLEVAGQPVPAGFFARYPETARAGASVLDPPPAPPASMWLIGNQYYNDQDRSYWCGPATMNILDFGDDGGQDGQANWANWLGTTTSGTGIVAIKNAVNANTGWDSKAGTYAIRDISGMSVDIFFGHHRRQLGISRAPIVEHPMLKKRYFDYLARDHGGHFQVGNGYNTSGQKIHIFEVYDERDFVSGAPWTGKQQIVPASKQLAATKNHAQQNVAW
jgi:hypothetical protein